MDEKFIVITPARDEQDYLPQLIDSITSQTLLPHQWVIVDDSSNDATANIAAEAARIYPWIKVVEREDRGYRNLDFGMVEAFYHGINHLTVNDYDFIFLLDADIVLGPKYFEEILMKFAANPVLGIAGGVVYEKKTGKLSAMPWSTYGAIKCWRRSCFQAIAGVIKGPGWDIIDNYRAMMVGWQTRSFEDEALKVMHLRPLGSSDRSVYHALIRSGWAMHFRGTHPLWLLASAFYNMFKYPYVVGGFALILGYLQASVKKSEKYSDGNFRRFLRKWQMVKLAQMLRLR